MLFVSRVVFRGLCQPPLQIQWGAHIPLTKTLMATPSALLQCWYHELLQKWSLFGYLCLICFSGKGHSPALWVIYCARDYSLALLRLGVLQSYGFLATNWALLFFSSWCSAPVLSLASLFQPAFHFQQSIVCLISDGGDKNLLLNWFWDLKQPSWKVILLSQTSPPCFACLKQLLLGN